MKFEVFDPENELQGPLVDCMIDLPNHPQYTGVTVRLYRGIDHEGNRYWHGGHVTPFLKLFIEPTAPSQILMLFKLMAICAGPGESYAHALQKALRRPMFIHIYGKLPQNTEEETGNI